LSLGGVAAISSVVSRTDVRSLSLQSRALPKNKIRFAKLFAFNYKKAASCFSL